LFLDNKVIPSTRFLGVFLVHCAKTCEAEVKPSSDNDRNLYRKPNRRSMHLSATNLMASPSTTASIKWEKRQCENCQLLVRHQDYRFLIIAAAVQVVLDPHQKTLSFYMALSGPWHFCWHSESICNKCRFFAHLASLKVNSLQVTQQILQVSPLPHPPCQLVSAAFCFFSRK